MFFFLVYVVLCFSAASATDIVDAAQRFSQEHNAYEMQFLKDKHPTVTQALNIKNSDITFKSVASVVIINNDVKKKMEQYYKNIPIYGDHIVVEVDPKSEKIESISGKFYEGIEKDVKDVTPKITKEQAFEIAKKNQNDEDQEDLDPETKLQIYIKSGKAYLTYHLEYMKVMEQKKPIFEIDAHTGEILDVYDGFVDGTPGITGITGGIVG